MSGAGKGAEGARGTGKPRGCCKHQQSTASPTEPLRPTMPQRKPAPQRGQVELPGKAVDVMGDGFQLCKNSR